MFTLEISGENPEIALFGWELLIQCKLADHAFSRLVEYAHEEVANEYDSKIPYPGSPIELIADCTVFLSATGVIRRILFPGNTMSKRVKTRSKNLIKLMEIPELSNLSSPQVRNSFEHVDERNDSILMNYSGENIVPIDLTGNTSKSAIVMKNFDPNTLSLSFLNDTIDLGAYQREILIVEKLAGAAINNRPHQSIDLYEE